jgi:hypothetical protein
MDECSVARGVADRELSDDETHLAGIDEILFEPWEDCLWKFAQCGQVSETYSITVIGALALPIARSPSGPTAMTSCPS